MRTNGNARWLGTATIAGLVVLFLLSCAGDPGAKAFDQGMREYERGRNVRAIALLEKSLNLRPGSPDNAVAYYYIGLAARRLGRIERAIEAFEASRRLEPDAYEPLYALAVIYYEGGDAERAQPLFEACAQRKPDDPRPLEFLAKLHLQAGRIAVARRTLLSALTRAPSSPRILTSLAVVEQAAGDASKAVFYLEQALQRDANYAPALFNMSQLQRTVIGDREAAEKYLERYVAAETNDARRLDAQALLASLRQPSVPPRLTGAVPPAVERGGAPAPTVSRLPGPTPTTAVESVSRAVPAGPKPPSLDERLAEARKLAERGKTHEAVEMCLALASEAEQGGDRAGQEKALRQAHAIGFDRSAVHVAWGRYWGARGDWTNALRSFKQAVILQRENTDAHRQLADAALRLGEYDAALVSLRQIVQLQPDAADAWWDLAVLYDEKINVRTRAVEHYREFARRFPGDARVVKAQKRLQDLEPPATNISQSEKPPPIAASAATTTEAPAIPRVMASRPSGEVRLNIRRPAVRNPQAAVQAYNRGTLYQQRGDWDQAIFYYTRALENDDTFVTAYFNLGSVYWTRGDHALAKEAYRRAIELEPQAPAVRYNLALLHYELREWEAAIQELKALIETTPDYAQAHYLLGMIHAQNPNELDLAKAHYQKFLELAPADPAAPAVQRWLRLQKP